MKLVRGITLEDILSSIGEGNRSKPNRFSLEALLTIFEKICDAVEFAHSKGIVHRDLKPANVMVGEYGEVLVLDWGMAKVLGKESPEGLSTEPSKVASKERVVVEDANLTSACILGTPSYMSPEQAQNQPVDTRSDIYTLGGILYNILTLQLPHEGEEVYEILDHIKEGRIRNPLSYNPPSTKRRWRPFHRKAMQPPGATLFHCPDRRIPEALASIAMKALALKPEDRYPDVRSLHDDILAYRGGFITSAETRSFSKLFKLLLKRRRTESILIGGGSLLIVVLTAIFLWELMASQRARVSALEGQIKAEEDRRRFEEKVARERLRNWRLVFREDFSRPDIPSRWDIIGPWEVKDGEFRMWGAESQIARLRLPVLGDVRLAFDCHVESEFLSDVTCFLGALKTPRERLYFYDGGYLFQYGGWHNQRITLLGPNGILWNKRASPLVRGKRYHVDAQKMGDRLILNVDGKTIIDVQDSQYVHGAEQAIVGFYGYKADVRYSNVRVYTRDSAESADLLETAEDFLSRGNYLEARTLFQEVMNSSIAEGRREKARKGILKATRLASLKSEFPAIRTRLLKVWPKARVELAGDGISIDIRALGVNDLGPLKGLMIRDLNCSYNSIQSLEPLRGVELKSLSCSVNQISSLEPLRGMPLVDLACVGNQIRNLEPLRGMNLKTLGIDMNQIADLESLRGMKLDVFSCRSNLITDLEPLRGMPLLQLSLDQNRVSSLEPLRGMLLNFLTFSSNQVANLKPLYEMDPSILVCNGNRIENLDPLRGTKLKVLVCYDNPVKSLKPVLENPPEMLCADLTDFSADEQEWIRSRTKEPRYASLFRNLEILSLLKKKDYDRIRSFARPYNGHHYLVIPYQATWMEAERICKEMKGHLVAITSKEEYDFVNSLTPPTISVWIGLVSKGKEKGWVTGEPFLFNRIDIDMDFPGLYGSSIDGVWNLAVPNDVILGFCVEWDD
jgi:hypothetical protein